MKATDLMIGDWVIRRGVPEEPMRLYNMNASKGIAYLDQDGRGVTELFENIEPIPLIPEILKKNATSIERYYIFGKYPNTLYVMFDSQTNVRIIEGDCEYYGIELKYVHELQHALKLYGIEKEVVI